MNTKQMEKEWEIKKWVDSQINNLYSHEESWPERDDLPVDKDPIGDVDVKKVGVGRYNVSVKNPHRLPLGVKVVPSGNLIPDIDVDFDMDKVRVKGKPIESKRCTHPNKYKNVISASLKFWYCPDCGEDWDVER